jgi:hypothetical protein
VSGESLLRLRMNVSNQADAWPEDEAAFGYSHHLCRVMEKLPYFW